MAKLCPGVFKNETVPVLKHSHSFLAPLPTVSRDAINPRDCRLTSSAFLLGPDFEPVLPTLRHGQSWATWHFQPSILC